MNWIKCSERKPELGTEILISDGKTVSYGEALGNGMGYLSNGNKNVLHGEVTHWMPLPEPPICHAQAASKGKLQEMLDARQAPAGFVHGRSGLL